METIRISVRNLVEFILRSGDIDNRKGGMADKEAMQLGSRLHRKIQGQMDAGYRAEVPLKYVETFALSGSRNGTEGGEEHRYELSVEGRADGIFMEDGQEIIDEIKGIYRPLSFLEEPVAVHLAQAKCYACIYAMQKDLPEVGVQMTYCNLESEEIRRFPSHYSTEELKEWFEQLISEYRTWCEFQILWKEKRQASIRTIRFPFSYREGQKDLAAAVYRTIQRKKKIFIQAPTGVGKTISTVFPAVKAVGEGLGEKIFYLTAKTITRTVAEEAFGLLKQQGLFYKVVTLTAKEKICPLEEAECDPVHCPYAKGHFDRINDAVFEMLKETDDFSREALLRQSEKWKVCPFELSLDVSIWVDAVICDYNYVFDPTAHLKRFFGEGSGGKGSYIFLIDEAHNLVERGREMYSALLWKEDLLEAKRAVQQKDKDSGRRYQGKKLIAQLERVNRQMLAWKRECEGRFEKLKSNEEELNRIFIDIYGLQDELSPEVDDKNVTVRLADKERDVRSFISYLVGVAMGRYSLNIPGIVYAGGEWDASKYVSYQPDDDGIIPIYNGIGMEDGLTTILINLIKQIFGENTYRQNIDFIAEALGKNNNESSEETLNRYLNDGFYADHLKTYQKRPIYWLFTSGKKAGFKCLIYMHRYNEDTLARINAKYFLPESTRKKNELDELNGRIAHAEGRDKLRLEKERQNLAAAYNEAIEYGQVLDHMANQYISIDLDDGVKVNYAKFQGVEIVTDGGSKVKKDLLAPLK